MFLSQACLKKKWLKCLIKIRTSVHFLWKPFYVPYFRFRHSFKEKCPLSGAKTQVKYVNRGMFLLRRYRYILLFLLRCFRNLLPRIRIQISGLSLKVNALSCWKYAHTKPTLNLPNSVNKCKTDIKTYLLMQPCYLNFLICRFELFRQTVITRVSNRSSWPAPWATERTYRPLKLIDMKLDMCDANVQKQQFSNVPAFLYCFEVVIWYSLSNCAKIMLYQSKLCKFVWKGVRVLLPLVFVSIVSYSKLWLLVRILCLAKKCTQVHKCHETR